MHLSKAIIIMKNYYNKLLAMEDYQNGKKNQK